MIAYQEDSSVFASATETKKIRVVVVAGQGIFAKALCQLLASDEEIEIAGDAETAASAALGRLAPDLVIYDVDGQVLKLDDSMSRMRKDVPNVRVCLLSTQLQPEVLQRGLAGGANGYIIKDVAPSELIRALKIIAAGGSYIDPRIAGELLRRRGSGNRYLYDLTARENEVIQLIAQGMSNKEISEQLGVSDKTVKNHVSHIFSKLNITARSQAAVHAVRAGLI